MNGWKNQTTLTINVLFMETIEFCVRQGMDRFQISDELKNHCQVDSMNFYARQLVLSAWAEIDWHTLIERATENVNASMGIGVK